MKHLSTLRVRFALWVAGLLLLTLAAFGGFVYVSLAQGLAASIDNSLQLSAAQALTAVNIENGQLNFLDDVPQGSLAVNLRERGVTIRILNSAGQIMQGFGPFQTLPVEPSTLEAVRYGQSAFTTLYDPLEAEQVRFYTAPITENNALVGIVQVALPLGDVQETLNQLLISLAVGAPLLTLVAALGGYALAARALAPIDHITQTARQISVNDLSARLNLPVTNDEVGRLAATFDSMLARLEISFKREHQFTADASHELRTPLAAMQAILSVIRAERRTPADYEQALTDLAEETDRLRALTEDLLQLARGDSQPVTAYERVDLSVLLNDVVASLQPLAESKNLSLSSAIPDGLSLSGDTDKLIRLFVNLIDNAIKYTEAGTVTLSAQADSASLHILVTDTGLGISPDHLPHIFDRFYRVDLARSRRGAGLGLAIAQEIAHTHGGTIEVSSAFGSGSTFTIHLPIS